MNLRKKSGAAVAGAGLIAAIALVAGGPSAVSHTGKGCFEGTTTFEFDLPKGITLKPTKGAVKRGPSKIKMTNCGGSFDPQTATGSLKLIGGINFKFEGQRGPTGDYRLRYGGVGKIRAKVVGQPVNLAKIVNGAQSVTSGQAEADGLIKLTTKGAHALDAAVGSDEGPWHKGVIGDVSSVFPLN